MEYREIKYYYKEWLTWDHQKASAFVCSDKNLLRHVSTVSFESSTLDELHGTIDFYLDNIEKCKELKKSNDYATAVFYETLKYKGD